MPLAQAVRSLLALGRLAHARGNLQRNPIAKPEQGALIRPGDGQLDVLEHFEGQASRLATADDGRLDVRGEEGQFGDTAKSPGFRKLFGGESGWGRSGSSRRSRLRPPSGPGQRRRRLRIIAGRRRLAHEVRSPKQTP